jgi:GNAT superfamily N-acetyltransferase
VAISLEIRPLRPSDDRSGFSCGQADLDRFFQQYAGQNQFKLHLSVTYIALSAEVIVGFATVVAGSIERQTLPIQSQARRLPNYPLPVLRLGRLGVDQKAHGLGIGQALLRHVFCLALQQRDTLGCIGVVTDAKPDAIAFYERYGFAVLEGVREGLLSTEPTPMFLSISTISAAI